MAQRHGGLLIVVLGMLCYGGWLIRQAPPSPSPVPRESAGVAYVRSVLIQADRKKPTPSKPTLLDDINRPLDRFVQSEPLRPETVQILRDAVIAATTDRPDVQRVNLDAVNRLAKLPWPRLSEPKRIRLEHWYDSQRTQVEKGWFIREDEEFILWLGEEFRIAIDHKPTDESNDRSRIVVDYPDFRQEMDKLCELLVERSLGNFEVKDRLSIDASHHMAYDKFKWDAEHGIVYHPFIGGGFGELLVHLAVVTADRGWDEITRDLVAGIFQDDADGLLQLVDTLIGIRLYQVPGDMSPGWRIEREGADPGEDWHRFLLTCEQLLATSPQGRYANELKSYIAALQEELSRPIPVYLSKPKNELTADEIIAYLIYRLRDFEPTESYPFDILASDDDSPSDLLIMIGTRAIPQLVAAMSDETPTRSFLHNRYGYLIGGRDVDVLGGIRPKRRQDFAANCVYRLTGCQFYPTPIDQLTPEQRESAMQHVGLWWEMSEGESQAEMLRNYLKTMHLNTAIKGLRDDTLYRYCRVNALKTLADLEGPEIAIDELSRLRQERRGPDHIPYDEYRPRVPVKWAFANLKKNRLFASNIDELLKYGGPTTYQRLANLAITNELIPDPDHPGKKIFAGEVPEKGPGRWFSVNHVRLAAHYGRNWAIPLYFAMLRSTFYREFIDDESIQKQFTADAAMQEIIKWTNRDFGYKVDNNEASRKRAFKRARLWWVNGGREELQPLIAKDHPFVASRGELLISRAK